MKLNVYQQLIFHWTFLFTLFWGVSNTTVQVLWSLGATWRWCEVDQLDWTFRGSQPLVFFGEVLGKEGGQKCHQSWSNWFFRCFKMCLLFTCLLLFIIYNIVLFFRLVGKIKMVRFSCCFCSCQADKDDLALVFPAIFEKYWLCVPVAQQVVQSIDSPPLPAVDQSTGSSRRSSRSGMALCHGFPCATNLKVHVS